MTKIIPKFLLKIVLIFALFFIAFSPLFFGNFSYAQEQNLTLYTGPIQHVFTHCLIADTKVAFDSKNTMKKYYDTDCLTVKEFKAILGELYKNNYILIKPSSIFDASLPYGTKKALYLPQGKKPLIMSFDDVNYDRKKSGKGMVDRILFDDNGDIVTYTSGKNELEYDVEFVSILENFIQSYPDFSYQGARGLICLTGYDGILGYRINKDSPNRQEEITKVKPIVNKLKQLGWEFASHSYGHYHMKKISVAKFEDDINKWKNEVESIVGKTSIYVYPYGEREIITEQTLSPKHSALEKAGFRLFCGVGVKDYFGYLPNSLNKKILFMDRTPLDGYTLRNNYMALSHLFDIKHVYDNARDIKLDDFYI